MDRAALEERLTGRARATADAAQRALQWFNDAANAGSVGQEQRALNREFRRFATAARKLEQAVARPMCVGVFGPSQAGKSYLVSVLARPGEKPLIADFDGEGKDFIAEINPEGGKEFTGLVTRFSLTRQAHPKGFPVCLRLLSEADVIKIIANTFFLDGDLSEEAVPSPEDIEAALRAARAAAGGDVPGLGEDEVYDIQEYVEKHFRGSEQARALQPFWEEAAQLAPRLQPEGRGALLAILWGGHEPFTRLYRLLAEALARLGHPADAFAPLDALIPREREHHRCRDACGARCCRRRHAEGLAARGRAGRAAASGGHRDHRRASHRHARAAAAVLRAYGPARLSGRALAPAARARPLLRAERECAEGNLPARQGRLSVRPLVAEQELTAMLLCIGYGNRR